MLLSVSDIADPTLGDDEEPIIQELVGVGAGVETAITIQDVGIVVGVALDNFVAGTSQRVAFAHRGECGWPNVDIALTARFPGGQDWDCGLGFQVCRNGGSGSLSYFGVRIHGGSLLLCGLVGWWPR